MRGTRKAIGESNLNAAIVYAVTRIMPEHCEGIARCLKRVKRNIRIGY